MVRGLPVYTAREYRRNSCYFGFAGFVVEDVLLVVALFVAVPPFAAAAFLSADFFAAQSSSVAAPPTAFFETSLATSAFTA